MDMVSDEKKPSYTVGWDEGVLDSVSILWLSYVH